MNDTTDATVCSKCKTGGNSEYRYSGDFDGPICRICWNSYYSTYDRGVDPPFDSSPAKAGGEGK